MTDPITAEIIRNYLDTSAEHLYETLCRTSPNPAVNEAKDCGGGIYSYDGSTAKVVSRAGIIAHGFALSTSCQAGLDFFRGDLHPGDVLLVGDPYHGGSHCGCWSVVVPIFFNGRPQFLAAARLHVLDQGGPVPATYNPGCREIWQEGLRVSPLKLYERGELRREAWDWLMANTRLPGVVEADIRALIGGCQVGERAIRDLVDRYGLDTVEGSLEWIFDYSERRFRQQIRQWPDGVYSAAFHVDNDFADHQDIKIQVAIVIDDDHMTLDFAGTDAQTDGIINSSRPNTIAYISTILSVLCPDIPINAGFYEALTIHLPEGTVVNPTAPAATTWSTIVAGGQIGEAVMKACEQFAPDRVGGAVIDAAPMFVFGIDEREHRVLTSSSENRFFIFADMAIISMSNSAVYGQDGWGMWATPFSVARPLNIEMTEIQQPTRYQHAELSIDSAAPGRWRGTPALTMRRTDYGASQIRGSFAVQSLIHPLAGWVGGYEGAGNFIVLNEGGPDERIAGEFVIADVSYDTAKPIFAQSGGGGGWGDPLDRDPNAVLNDVLDEYISVEGAKQDYGVVIELRTWAVDVEATARERAERKAQPGPRKRRGLGRQRTIKRTGIEHRIDRPEILAANAGAAMSTAGR